MFNSFFLAGFECATGYNLHGDWIDQIAATNHDQCVLEDYRALYEVGIRAVREGVRWPLVDRAGHYDFSTVEPFIQAAREHGIEVVWDLFHYGYPLDIDLFSLEFAERFANYCRAIAAYIGARTNGTCYFTPINEPSYYAWAAGQVGWFAPHQRERGPELKICLARAAIQGINAIRDVCPEARIINADPICRVVPPRDRPDLQPDADYFNQHAVFESWDMLAGRILPELGGSPEHLDMVGINYYWTNQWELGRCDEPLGPADDRCVPLGDLVRSVWSRYGQEMLITETGHIDELRSSWLRHVAWECEALLRDDIPLRGVCLYPILGMPEWHAQQQWARMGLWDLYPGCPTMQRVLYRPMLDALREAQRLESSVLRPEYAIGLAA